GDSEFGQPAMFNAEAAATAITSAARRRRWLRVKQVKAATRGPRKKLGRPALAGRPFSSDRSRGRDDMIAPAAIYFLLLRPDFFSDRAGFLADFFGERLATRFVAFFGDRVVF